MSDRAQQISKHANKLFASDERVNTDRTWQLISEFMLPSQAGNFSEETTPGRRNMNRVFDSTAIQANHDLAASIHSVLTNPAIEWSKIRFKDEQLNNNGEAIAWLEKVNKSIHDSFSESNFNNEIAKNYKLFTSLGSMAFLQEEEDHDDGGRFKGFRFKAVHLSEIAWAENEKGIVDLVYRRFKLTAKQAVERWGDKLGEDVLKALETDPNKKFTFIHMIGPRDPKKVKLNSVGLASPKARPFESIYVQLSNGQSRNSADPQILEEGGYYEFPLHVVRWETMPGEVYGRGPGHTALPDVRTLNKVKELGLQAINKAINPPMIANQRSVLGSLDLRPGRISIVRDVDGLKEMPPQARFDVTNFAVEDLKNSVKSIFFLDKLLLPPRPEVKTEMTAFEIAQRVEQMQKVLGPTLGRLNFELLQPLILRAFKMMLRGGALPPMPVILQELGIDVEIVFVNTLARSQKMEEVTSIQALVQDVAFLMQLRPEAGDLLDVDSIIRLTSKIRGVPESAIADQEVVDQTREARAQAQQAQAALEAGVQAADISAKTNPGGQQ